MVRAASDLVYGYVVLYKLLLFALAFELLFVSSREGVEYLVDKRTTSVENFSESGDQILIKSENKIYSAFGDGRVPFISATDIANVAFHALTDEKAHNTDYMIVGPELLTFDEVCLHQTCPPAVTHNPAPDFPKLTMGVHVSQVAAKLSASLGRPIEHVKLSQEERVRHYVDRFGLPQYLANLLAGLEAKGAKGGEERMNDVVERVTGRKAKTFDEFVRENKGAWALE